MSTLSGKVAVVSGGTSGIGLAIAQRFVAEGAHVFLFGRRQSEVNQAAELLGPNATALQADVTKFADIDQVAATIKAKKGVIDIIVSNAGLTEEA